MAVKDWKIKKEAVRVKKVSKFPVTQWINKKNQKVGIVKDNTGTWWFKWSGHSNVTRGKKFKTKASALKHAKEYMKKY